MPHETGPIHTKGSVMSKRIDIAPGTRFGKLAVTAFAGVSKQGVGVQHCVCDCGRTVKRKSHDLVAGRCTSCEIGQCHHRWRGGKDTAGSRAWACWRLSRIKLQSRKAGYAEPYEDEDRVIELWNACAGLCACCGMKSCKTLHLDHCHETGRLRGFVCGTCNVCIGYTNENASQLVSMASWVAWQPKQHTWNGSTQA